MQYKDFKSAIKILNVSTRLNKKQLREQYLNLSKIYHPDGLHGDSDKFNDIHEAYKILCNYIENFRFSFEKDEFKGQYPLFDETESDWLSTALKKE